MRFKDLRTTAELVTLYRFKNANCCRDFLRRHQIPIMRRGRVLLVDTRDMDLACTASASRAWDRFYNEKPS